MIEPVASYQLSPDVGYLVAADNLGAGDGEMVIVVFGEPARIVMGSSSLPLEAAVLTIVDELELGEEAVDPDTPGLPEGLATRLSMEWPDKVSGKRAAHG